MAFSLPNIASANALQSSVLPTPVGPRKINEPMGRSGSLRPTLPRRIALCDRRNGGTLPYNALVQNLLQLQKPFAFGLGQLADRYFCGGGYKTGNILSRDPLTGIFICRRPFGLSAFKPLAKLTLFIAQSCRLFIILCKDSGVFSSPTLLSSCSSCFLPHREQLTH